MRVQGQTAGERIRADGVFAILRRIQDPKSVVERLVAGGIRTVEITLDSDGALQTIGQLRERGDVTVLAGTVIDADDAERAVEAGAEGCIAPITRTEMVERCHALGVAVVPGAFTPTEIAAAWRLEPTFVKLFPAGPAGPDYLRDVRGPLRDVPFVCTGGVTPENAPEFLAAGAVAVGLGSALVALPPGEVERAAGTLVERVSAVRGG